MHPERQTPMEDVLPSPVLSCPRCLGVLLVSEDFLRCSGCESVWPIVDGIPVFRTDTGERDGEYVLREFVHAAGENLEQAVQAFIRRSLAPPQLGEEILGMARAGWQFLLPVAEKARVLELGCGWGGLAYSLARTCGQVVAMDEALEKLKVLRIRVDQDGIENLQVVCSSPGNRLPFQPRTFDLVVLGCVSKWLPDDLQSNLFYTHENVLKEILRVLKPSGALYVGVRNRTAWRSWFSWNDSGSDSRFVSLGHRRSRVAHSDLAGKASSFRVGKRAYERLLNRCGLGHTQFYVPLPTLPHPSAMMPAEDKKRLAQQVQRVVFGRKEQVAQKLKGFLDSHFPDAYGVVARKETSPSFLERIAEHIRANHALETPAAFHYRMNGEMGMVTVLYRGNSHSNAFVLKLPIHDRGETELKREVELLENIHSGKSGLSRIAFLCPRVLGKGKFEKQYYALFSIMPGWSGDKLLLHPANWTLPLQEGVWLAIELHESGLTESGEALQTRLEELGNAVRSLAWDERQRRVVEKAVALVAESFSGIDHPLRAFGHGDMKPANLLFDPKNLKLTGVIDWGASGPGELTGYDVQFLMVDIRRKLHQRSLAQELRLWIRGEFLEEDIASTLAEYAERTGLPDTEKVWQGIAAYQWLKRLAPLAGPFETQRFNHLYLDEMFGIFE